ncbi:MAG: 1-acyl-sn-glycerol-3-phosphate acyltransferase [Pirellulales bacterium]
MQEILIEKPYQFIPPHRGNWCPSLIQRLNLYGMYLNRKEGVEDYELRNEHLLKQSLDAGHGIMLTPNHCRTSDPLVMGYLSRAVGCHLYSMASWHLFNQGWFNSWAIRLMGGFSVYREGIDRKSINTAIDTLVTAERPLVIFPEGSTTRTNDHLHALLDGISFIARTAAKKREKAKTGKVVVHPIALKYLFRGNLFDTIDPVLAQMEHRFTWKTQQEIGLTDRVTNIGMAILALKELEYFGEVQSISLEDRLKQLIDRLLGPLEQEWLGSESSGTVVPRVKALRMNIMPDMVKGNISEEERTRRWDHLRDIYLAQQVSCYLPDYLTESPSIDRILETVERYEEDLTDKITRHGSLKVILEVGEAIEVSSKRDKSLPTDPLMNQIELQLTSMMANLAKESPQYQG